MRCAPMQDMSRASTNYISQPAIAGVTISACQLAECTSHYVAALFLSPSPALDANIPSMSPLLKRVQGVAFLLTLVFTILAGDSLLIFPLIPLLWLSPYLYSYAHIVSSSYI